MSWDADLIDDRGHEEGQWNYTHNCNGMANAVLRDDPTLWAEVHARSVAWWRRRNRDDVADREDDNPEYGSWWDALDDMTGPEGAAFLDRIIRGLEADPERFRAMNPDNGWGDFDSFVKVLTEMRNAVPEWPTKWSVSG